MMNSHFAKFDHHNIHYWEVGTGFPILMIHGVGPGTSILGNFGPVLEPLSQKCHIFAMDLIGFGESGRKNKPPFFDLDLWIKQALFLIKNVLPDGPCGIAGHSLGGALSLKISSQSKRIKRVLTSSTIGSRYKINDALDQFWTLPKNKNALKSSMTKMAFDNSALTEEMINKRWKLLQADGYADYFNEMFVPPRQQYIDLAVVEPEEIKNIGSKVVMLHGSEDLPCPPQETTIKLATYLPKAKVHLLPNCGHNLPRERTADYIAVATELFGNQNY